MKIRYEDKYIILVEREKRIRELEKLNFCFYLGFILEVKIRCIVRLVFLVLLG